MLLSEIKGMSILGTYWAKAIYYVHLEEPCDYILKGKTTKLLLLSSNYIVINILVLILLLGVVPSVCVCVCVVCVCVWGGGGVF